MLYLPATLGNIKRSAAIFIELYQENLISTLRDIFFPFHSEVNCGQRKKHACLLAGRFLLANVRHDQWRGGGHIPPTHGL